MEPMKGVRVVDVTTNASGPMAAGMLADQGADVIRLETIGGGDPSRHVGGSRGGVSAYTAYMNRNKRSVAVDLKNPAVRPAIYKLIESADVFVQNSRPGALERAGYGFEALRKVNPRLIYASISGFGARGPAAGQRVYDPVIQCVAGFATAQGVDGRPELVKTIVSDKVAARTAAHAIAAALYARERGLVSGHQVELSMLDASLAFLWPEVYWNHSFVGDAPVDARPPLADFYRLLETRDGWITMIVVGDGEFAGVCRALGLSHLHEDARFKTLAGRFGNYPALLEAFMPAVAARASDELIAALEREDVPCAKANSLDAVFDDPRVAAGASIIEYTHPAAGPMRQARPPAVFGGEPLGVRLPSPLLGEHTDEVLHSLGCSDDELAALRHGGAIA